MKNGKGRISLIGLFLVFAAILNVISPLAICAAEGSAVQVTATTSKSAFVQGNTGYCYVYIDSLESIASLSVTVHYDSSKIKVTSGNVYNKVSCSLYDNSVSESSVQFSYIFDEGPASKTQLFYFTYTVLSDAEVGQTAFDIVVNEAYDFSLEPISVSGSRCPFTISEKVTTKSCSIYSSSSLSTSVKEEFELAYRFSTSQIASGSLVLSYDPEMFELVDVRADAFLNGKTVDINDKLVGAVYLSFAGTVYSNSTYLMTVRFRTLKNMSDTSTIKLTVPELFDLDLNPISCGGYNTTVNINFDSSYAEDAPGMVLRPSYDTESQKLVLSIDLEENSMLGAGDFVLNFDPDALTYISSTKGFSPTFFNINDKRVAEGVLKFSIISFSDITDSTSVLHVEFDVVRNCEDRTLNFEIGGSGLTDSLTNEIVLNFVDASIMIPQKHIESVAVEENRVEPDCENDGSYDLVVYCSECNVELSREKKTVEKLGHDYSDQWTVDIEPTCTEKGSKSHHCTRCESRADVTEIPAKGHTYGDWYEIETPSCTETGVDEHKCTVCGHTETRVTDANGHTKSEAVEENRVEPDCENDGSYDLVVYCSECKVELSREKKIIEKLGYDHFGQCGEDVWYEFCSHTGILKIFGTGDMWGSLSPDMPWDSYRYEISIVEIADGVTSIGDRAFYECIALTNVAIPESVTSIGIFAFAACISLTSVEIPASVASIGASFVYCSNLAAIIVDDANTTFCSIDGVLFSKDKKTLVAYPGGGATSYTIPYGVTSIEGFAFYYCDSLTSVEIPDSVTSIGNNAFGYCSSLASVTFKTKNATIDSSSFSSCDNLETIYLYRNSSADKYFSSTSYTKKYLDVYAIVYDINGGTGVFNPQTFKEYESITLHPHIPSKTGYTFKGWLGSDGKTYNAGDVYSGNADLTLAAQWEIKTYTVTYNVNGGTNAPANATKEHFANYIVSAVVPAKTGYIFKGWLGSDGKTYNAGDVYSGNADLTLKAIWEAKSIVVIYDTCGGIISSATKTVKYEQPYGSLVTPERMGYTFDGWYTEKDDGTKITAGTVVDFLEAKTIYAHWIANSYIVTFNANAGIISELEKTVVFDSAYGELPTPVLAGFVFDGWYTEIDGGELVTAETIVKMVADHTLYARWKGAEYLVIFDANGGECEMESQTVIFGAAFGELPIPTRTGYTFIAWSKTKTTSGAVNAETIYQSTSNTTLYAVWEVNTYKLTLDALGGTINIDYKMVTYGSAYGDLPISLYPNYIFGGWFFEKEYKNKLTSDMIVSIASDHTVYAMWIPATFTVVYDANGGEGVPDGQTKNLDVDLVLSSEVPTRKGYKFLGWSTTADGAVRYAPGATYSENANLTLFAVWKAIGYGDTNGDGVINAKDSVLLAQHLASWDVNIDVSAADCNGDGTVNAKDAVLLAQYLANWDVTLG